MRTRTARPGSWGRSSPRARGRAVLAALVLAASVLSACTQAVVGSGSTTPAANADLTVIGDSHGQFDTTVKNALSDIEGFWRASYPSVSGGKPLPALTGGLFSVDGDTVLADGAVTGAAGANACLHDDPESIIDNAFYCDEDDSIVWDRAPDHLVPVLGQKYGQILVAMVFAHEFGHAIQQRLGILDESLPTIDTESEADCASGAFIGAVLHGQAPHFQVSPAQLDAALNGYLLVRDQTPKLAKDISHGNGFDRLSAVEDGIEHGVTYCYGKDYFDRQFTERPAQTDQDLAQSSNHSLAQVLNPADPAGGSGAWGLQPSLNHYWTAAAKTVDKTFPAVTIAQAATPKCGATADSEFGYCPDDNTVYYSQSFAATAYRSLATLQVDQDSAQVSVRLNQPADFALGELFAIGWGLSVRHELFAGSTTDAAGLEAAICYSGAYAKSVNVDEPAGSSTFALEPADLDEATSAVLNLVGLDQAYGARGTTGLQRVQDFVKGYNGGLSAC